MKRLARPLGTALLAMGMAATILAAPARAVPDTTISFTASPTATIGEYNMLTVSITSSDGITQPEGGVVFRNQAGQIVGTAATGRGSSIANAVATLPWWPTQQTTYTFTAQYSPAPGVSLNGSTTAAPFTILATPSGQNVSMSAPQMYLGIPATMTATLYPPSLQGSVGFTANGWGLGPSVPITKGTATFTFTPGSLGWQQFGVSFTSTNVPGAQGQVAQWVNVLPASAAPALTTSNTSTALASAPAATSSKKPAGKPSKRPRR